LKEEDIRKREVLDRYLELVRDDVGKIFGDFSLFQQIPCPACRGTNHRKEFEKLRFHYVSCMDCETLFVNPRPRADLLDQFYVESLSTHFWINDFFKPMVAARQEKIFRPRAENLARRFGPDPEWTVGDVGAGFGLFLIELRKIWPRSRMVAIEPSPEQAEICRSHGLEVFECTIEEVQCESHTFDLLVAFELIEHLYAPALFINKVWNLLKPGGWFLITTLNVQGFDIQVLWEHSKAIYPPHHLNFFNPDSLSVLLTHYGFHVEEVTTPGQLDYDIVEGMILREGADVDRFWKLVARKSTPMVKQDLQKWISQSLLSSHMNILARRQS